MTAWTLVETEDEWWEILDGDGSLKGRYGTRELALFAAANEAEGSEALAVHLHSEADDAQEIADSLRTLCEVCS